MSSPRGDDAARTAARQWARIITVARTAEQHAAVMDVRRRFHGADPPPVEAMVHAYRAVIAARSYAPLNAVRLLMVQLADLAVIVNAAAAGLPAAAVEQASREVLHRHRLVTLLDPRGQVTAFPDDPRTRVVATRAGLAVLRGAGGRPLHLSEADAFTLTQVDAHRPQVWPGAASCLRACHVWGLIRRAAGCYHLTAPGRDALAYHRGNGDAERKLPNDGQAEVLERANANNGSGVDLGAFTVHHIAQCVTRQWLVKAGSVRPTGRGSARPLYRITDSGRDALDRHRLARRLTGEVADPVTVGKIEPGQRIRVLRRRGLDVPKTFALLVRKNRVPVPGTCNQGFELWVSDTDGAEPYLYGGKAFYPTTRFEVEPDAAA